MSGYKRNGRKFGFTMAVPLGLIALFLLYKGRTTGALITGAIAALFILFALAAPKLLEPVERVWMAFALVLGAINTRILMGLLYFLFIVPLSLFFKLVGRDEMRRRLWAKNATSNWEDYRPRQRDTRHYENMF